MCYRGFRSNVIKLDTVRVYFQGVHSEFLLDSSRLFHLACCVKGGRVVGIILVDPRVSTARGVSQPYHSLSEEVNVRALNGIKTLR